MVCGHPDSDIPAHYIYFLLIIQGKLHYAYFGFSKTNSGVGYMTRIRTTTGLFKTIPLLFILCLLVSILTVEAGEQQGSLGDRCPTCVDNSIDFAFDGSCFFPRSPLSDLIVFFPSLREDNFTCFDSNYPIPYRGPPLSRVPSCG